MRARTKIMLVTAGLAILGIIGVASNGEFAGAGSRSRAFQYEVQLTNLTRGQIFSPAVVVTHGYEMQPLFTLGEPASEELAAVAEDAITDPLVMKLEASESVNSVTILTGENGPILPGETATAVVEVAQRASRLSLVGMLVTTNDGFYALNGKSVPLHGEKHYTLLAYDAGSEANNELCSHIPGPPCDNPGVRDTEGAEGYVHVHAGVHGLGDLDPAQHDWRNPVALVTLRRLIPSPANR